MSIPAIKALTKVQIGLEDTPGGGAVATRRLYQRNATYRAMTEEDTGEDELHGTLARVARPPVVTKRWTELELEYPLDFVQILFPLLSGVQGGITPTIPNGTARLWRFEPDIAGGEAPDTFALEYEERSPADADGLKATHGFTKEFTISGGDNGLALVNQSLVAGATVEGAATAALTLPVLDRAPSLKWKVYVDDALDDIGESQILGQIYNFSAKYTGFEEAYYLDGNSSLSFSQAEERRRILEVTFDVTVDPTSGQFVPIEKAAKAAADLRFVRIAIEGAAIAGTSPSLTEHFYIEGGFYHATDSLQERGGERNGNTMVRVHLFSAIDEALEGQDVAFEVQNALGEFAAAGGS